LGFCGIAKPSNGKLVLRTGSIGIVCKNMKRVIIPQEYVEKIKESAEFLRRNGNIKTDQFWTFRHDLWKIASY
jgi:hypothetical protein